MVVVRNGIKISLDNLAFEATDELKWLELGKKIHA